MHGIRSHEKNKYNKKGGIKSPTFEYGKKKKVKVRKAKPAKSKPKKDYSSHAPGLSMAIYGGSDATRMPNF